MKKLNLLFFFCLFFVFNFSGNAQKIEVSVGKPTKTIESPIMYQSAHDLTEIGCLGNCFYSGRTDGMQNKLEVDKFDKDHNLLLSKRIELSDSKERYRTLVGLYIIKGQLYMFTRQNDIEFHLFMAKEFNFYCTKLDQNFERVGDETLICTIRGHYRFDALNYLPAEELSFSPDSSKILIKTCFKEKGDNDVTISYKVLTTNFEPVFDKNIKGANFSYQGKSIVGNDGTIYALHLMDEHNGKYRSRKLFCCSPSGKEKKLDLPKDEEASGGYRLKIAPNNDILVMGYLCEEKRTGINLLGIFYFRIDGTSWTKRFQTVINADEKVRNGLNDELQYFYEENIESAANGDIFYSMVSVMNSKFNKSGPELIIKLDQEGKMIWENLIMKKQYGEFTYNKFDGTFAKFIGNHIYIFYNEEEKNLKKISTHPTTFIKKYPEIDRLHSPCLMVAIININSGEMSVKKVYDYNYKENKGIIMPRYSYQPDPGHIYFLVGQKYSAKYSSASLSIENQ